MNEQFNVSDFDSVEDIDVAIKALQDQRKELSKEQDALAKEASKAKKQLILDQAKNHMISLELSEGTEITAYLKGELVEGVFSKITDKRFIILVDGESKTLPFDKFVGLVEPIAQAV